MRSLLSFMIVHVETKFEQRRGVVGILALDATQDLSLSSLLACHHAHTKYTLSPLVSLHKHDSRQNGVSRSFHVSLHFFGFHLTAPGPFNLCQHLMPSAS